METTTSWQPRPGTSPHTVTLTTTSSPPGWNEWKPGYDWDMARINTANEFFEDWAWEGNTTFGCLPREHRGSLQDNGDWHLAASDCLGQKAVGDWWPTLVPLTWIIGAAMILGLISYGAQIALTPCTRMGKLASTFSLCDWCSKRPPREVASQQAAANLPSTLAAETTAVWRGPGAARFPEATYPQQKIKSRSTTRIPRESDTGPGGEDLEESYE